MGCAGTKETEGDKNILMNLGFEKALAYLTKKDIKGLGFLCKLSQLEEKSILPALITTTDLIGKEEIDSKQISFIVENKRYSIAINEDRKTYINEDKYKIVIIEIKNEDNLDINSFFEIEEKEKINQTSFIGVIQNNDKLKYLESYICKVNNINENGYLIDYSCKNTSVNNSIGNPIINIRNNKIFGLQGNSGSGILVFDAIKEFLEADLKKEKEVKNIYQSLKKTFTLKSTIKIDKAKLNNEIGILYLLPFDLGIPMLKIFGEEFVDNNIDKCKLILYDNEKDEEFEHELCTFLEMDFINSINSGRKLFKLFLIQTDYIYDFSFMFSKCYTLMSVEGLNDLYYDQATNMAKMFYACELLQELDFGQTKINTSQVKDMTLMFHKCESLRNLNLSGLNTSSVRSMKGMFEGCQKLQMITGLENWDLSSLKDASFMFNFCKQLVSFYGISKWNTTSITDMSNMFKGLETIIAFPDVSNWEMKNVKNISGMFCSCINLNSISDLSKWNTESVESLYLMFYNCSKLMFVPDISNWNTSKVKSIKSLFNGCSSLSFLPNISKWNTQNMETMSFAFVKCTSLKSLPDISNWNVGKVTDFTQIFGECASLTSVPDLSNWNISSAVKLGGFFTGCASLQSVPDLSKWNVENVEDFSGIFNNCENLLSLPDISNWNTSNGKDMSYLFSYNKLVTQ